MKRFVFSVQLVCFFTLLTFALPASARETGPYFNVSIGNSEYDAVITNFDDSNSYLFGAGYSFNRHLAFEANFIDFGDSEDNIFPEWTLNTKALEFCGVGKVSLTPVFSVYAKFGFFSWDADVTDIFGIVAEDDGTDTTVGLGLLLKLGDRAATYFNYQNYDFTLEGVDIPLDNMSLGFQLYF